MTSINPVEDLLSALFPSHLVCTYIIAWCSILTFVERYKQPQPSKDGRQLRPRKHGEGASSTHQQQPIASSSQRVRSR